GRSWRGAEKTPYDGPTWLERRRMKRILNKIFDLGPALGAATAALGSAGASICCLGPLGVTLLGVNGAIFAAGLKPYRGYLLGASLALIGVGFRSFHRRRSVGAACSTRMTRWTRRALWVSVILFGLAIVAQIAYRIYSH
ncbi:MAG: mercuric transporter MerT family protein, partial [Gemmatimonadota bacterium]